MHPYQHAQSRPDHPALIVADTGERLTYRELDESSNRLAHYMRRKGLRPGDRIAVMLRNCAEFPIVYWGAQRSGVMVTLVSTHLKPAEVSYILGDCGAQLLITSADVGETAVTLAGQRGDLLPKVAEILNAGAARLEGAQPLAAAIAEMPAIPVADETSGFYILYSSGTTGRPKGIVAPFAPTPIDQILTTEGGMSMFRGYDPLVAFCAGPLYHGAPIAGMIATQRLGGTYVTLKRFDAARTLQAIQDYRVVHGQFVPTMFVRMLALPEEVRRGFDLSSLKFVIHAAAPCPIEIKHRMMNWLGPIIYEYYGGSEGIGGTFIGPQDWLRKPGSVGRSSTGPLHVCAEDGTELPPNESGIVYFETAPARQFNYLNDPEKTRKARNPLHPNWITLGDIGRLDDEGFLFLTDRKDFMIISGGVNIYPQAVEDALIVHPGVIDAAVIGVPDPEFGEEVKAIVQPLDWADAGDSFAADLIAWCRDRISAISCPRSIQFVQELPRLASGKLAKHELRRLYGGAQAVRKES